MFVDVNNCYDIHECTNYDNHDSHIDGSYEIDVDNDNKTNKLTFLVDLHGSQVVIINLNIC